MASEKYFKLVDRLVEKTERKNLDWKEGVYPGSFQVSFPNYSLTIQQMEDDQGTRDYILNIIDVDGNTIDRFSDIDLGPEYFKKLGELYQNARRQALGVDKALDEILDELDSPF